MINGVERHTSSNYYSLLIAWRRTFVQWQSTSRGAERAATPECYGPARRASTQRNATQPNATARCTWAVCHGGSRGWSTTQPHKPRIHGITRSPLSSSLISRYHHESRDFARSRLRIARSRSFVSHAVLMIVDRKIGNFLLFIRIIYLVCESIAPVQMHRN